jgi:hypothetical protein
MDQDWAPVVLKKNHRTKPKSAAALARAKKSGAVHVERKGMCFISIHTQIYTYVLCYDILILVCCGVACVSVVFATFSNLSFCSPFSVFLWWFRLTFFFLATCSCFRLNSVSLSISLSVSLSLLSNSHWC